MSKEAGPTLAAGALTANAGDPPAPERSGAEDDSMRGHHPDAETILAKAHMEMEKHASEMSLIEKQIARADTFKVGMKFRHDIHGPGMVVEILPDGRRRMEFENGERHAYKPSSMHKLHPIVDDAHTFTPACAAALGVQRSPKTRQPHPTGLRKGLSLPSAIHRAASIPTLTLTLTLGWQDALQDGRHGQLRPSQFR
jgi:hypothetical protein